MRVPFLLACAFAAVFAGLPLIAVFGEALLGAGALADVLANPNDRAAWFASLALGAVATLIACLLGGGYAWLTHQTDLPLVRWLAPLGVAPLAVPPITVAMGFADLLPMQSFLACAGLMGLCNAPFVAVLTARGLRAVDGREYEAALLARGRAAAERLLLRMVAPELLAGGLLAFLFTVSERSVPEFLTVKGKTWHTYAEVVYRLWTRRATGVTAEDLASPVVAAIPLVLLIAAALYFALRLRAAAGAQAAIPLPQRHLGRWRGLAMVWPLVYLGLGVVLPIVVMARWAAGSTAAAPMALSTLQRSLFAAVDQVGGDLGYTLVIAAATSVLVLLVALPLARRAGRDCGYLDALTVVPLAVPGVLFAIGCVQVWNSEFATGFYTDRFDFYDSGACVVAAYTARLLPFGVLTLSSAVRRIPRQLDEAAQLAGRSGWAQLVRVHAPLLTPAAWSAACLILVLALRELDIAVVLPAGNSTVVRRLSNVVHFGGEDVGGALALYLIAIAVLVPLLGAIVSGRRPTSLS